MNLQPIARTPCQEAIPKDRLKPTSLSIEAAAQRVKFLIGQIGITCRPLIGYPFIAEQLPSARSLGRRGSSSKRMMMLWPSALVSFFDCLVQTALPGSSQPRSIQSTIDSDGAGALVSLGRCT